MRKTCMHIRRHMNLSTLPVFVACVPHKQSNLIFEKETGKQQKRAVPGPR